MKRTILILLAVAAAAYLGRGALEKRIPHIPSGPLPHPPVPLPWKLTGGT